MQVCWILSLVIVYGSSSVTGVNTTVSTQGHSGCNSPTLTNGVIQFSNDTYVRSVATYICSANYYINGTCEQNTTSTCLMNGSWSDPTPNCILKGEGISFSFSKIPFIEDSHDNIVMECFTTFDATEISVQQIEIRKKLPSNSTWVTVASIDSTNIPTPNLSNKLATKSVISGSFISGPNLTLTVNESVLVCEDVALYQCYISYTAEHGQCYGEINKQLDGFFFPKSVHLEAKRNNVNLENSNLSFPTQLKLGDTLDLICTAQVGNNPNDISWKASTSYSAGKLLPVPPSGPVSQGTAGNFSDCQYTRTATIKHSVDTTDLSTGNISYTCYVNVVTPDGQTSKDIEADQVLHVEIYSTCPRPPPPEHGSVSITGTTVDSEAFLSCEQGYQRSTGFSTCDSSGTWNTPMTCDSVDCSNKTAPPNGSVIYKNSTLFKGIAEIYCDEGFYLNGSTTSVCQADGNWSDTDSRCILLGCAKLPPLSNGIIELSNSSNINSTLSFSCSYGYDLVGASVATCRDDGWNTSLPSCKAIECLTPLTLANGYVSLDNDKTEVNDTITFSCFAGYKLVGTAKTECTITATWHDDVPSCIVKNCTNPPLPPKHGYISSITGLSVNSTAMLACNRGYDLMGDNMTQCTYNETWSPVSTLCLLIECPVNQLFAHGELNISTSRYVNDTSQIACDPGYVLDGSSTVVCIENGTWETSSSKCIPKNCTYPLAPNNGYISSTTGLTVNSTAVIACNVGYNLTGSDIIQCTETATWSKLSAVCNLTECSLNQLFAHGEFNISTSRYVNDTAQIACDPGYVLDGSSTVVCIENGTWETSTSKCIPKNCTYPIAPNNGYISSTTGLTVNSTAVIACNVGYNLTGSDIIQCTETATWSNLSAMCNLIELADD